MKKFLLFTALLCATTIVANDTEYPQMDTVFVEGDTIDIPYIPEPIHLDLSVSHKALLASECFEDSIVGLDENGNYASKVEYEYDEAGHVISETVYQWQKGVKIGVSKFWKKYTGITATTTVNYKWNDVLNDWERKDSTQYLYYPNGMMQSNAKYVWENGAWHYTTLAEYLYNDSKVLIQSLNSSWNNSQQALVYTSKREYAYDANGNKTLDASWNYKDNAWIGSTKSAWEYDTKNNKKLEEYYSGWENNDWKGIIYNSSRPNATGKTIYEYNDANKITRKIIFTWANGTWEGYQKTETEYDGANVTDNAVYTWSNGDWTGSSRTSTVWTAGKATEEITYSWVNKAWVYKNKTNKEYSGSNQTMQAYYTWKEETWVGSTKWEKTYAGTLVTSQINFVWGTDDWMESTKEETTYTEAGKIATKMTYKWDAGSWLGITKEENTYDSANRPLCELKLVWGDSDWENKSRTVYEYGKGNNSLIAKANWTEGIWQATDSTKRVETYIIVAGKEKIESDTQTKWTSSAGWAGISKSIWQYDEAANTIQTNSYVFKDGEWVNKEERKYEFKDNNASLKTLEQAMTWSSDHWIGSFKYEYEYDDNNRQVSSARYTWNKTKDDWQGASKSFTIWNNGQIEQSISYSWNTTIWDWVGSFRNDYAYDQKGRQTENVLFAFNATLNVWVPKNRYVDKYDNKHSESIKTEEFYWIIEDEDDPEDGYWCHTTKVEKSFDETGEGRLRYNLNITYSSSECDVITLYDMQRYYYSCDNYYTIRFLDWDNTELESQQVLEGYKPFDDNIRPTRQDDAQYTYEFNGWDKELVAATSNAVYTAVYTQTTKQYTVIFKDEAGNEWQKSKFDYGTEPVYTNMTPTKEGDAQFTYSFAGWGDGLLPVHGDTAYIAKFDVAVNKYNITFSYGEQSHIETLEYGALIATEWVPELINTAEFEYSFVGWKELAQDATVAGTASYEADVTATKRSYDITFSYGEQSHIETLEYGALIATEWVPELINTAEFEYSFVGWKELAQGATVAGTASYEADVTATKRSYDITFVVGEENYSTSLQYGTSYATILAFVMEEFGIVENEGKYQFEDADFIYTFIGWEEVEALPETVTESATYTMRFSKEAKVPTGVESVENEAATVKVYENGVLYILRNGKKFTTTGSVVE